MLGTAQASKWEERRFGALAGVLRGLVPDAMSAADGLAARANAEAEATTSHVYGTSFWLKSNELLIERASGVDGLSVRKLEHVRRYFDCVVVEETSTVIIPLRLTGMKDGDKRVRLKNPPSNSLTFLLGPAAVQHQMHTLDDELFGVMNVDVEQELRELDEQISAFAAVVAVGVECSLRGGITHMKWGELRLRDDDALSAEWNRVADLEFVGREDGNSRQATPEIAAVGGIPIQRKSAAGFYRGEDEGDDLGITLKNS